MSDKSILDLIKDGLRSTLEDLTNRQDEILSMVEAENGLANVKITINLNLA